LWLALLQDSKRAKSDACPPARPGARKVDWFLKELEEIGNIFASGILTLKGKK